MFLSAHVKQKLPQLTQEQRYNIENAMIDINLKLCDARSFAAFIKPIGIKPAQVKELKNEILSNFDSGPRLKYAMVWIARRPEILSNKSKLVVAFHRFGLDPSHIEAFHRLQAQDLLNDFIIKAKEAPIEVEHIEHARKLCGVAISAIYEFTKKFAIRKMRFITKSNNEPTIDPIVQDLLEQATSMFYEITPWLSWEHTINYLKRTVHSRGINRIKFETTSTRQRLIGEPGFHTNRIISLDTLYDKLRRHENSSIIGQSSFSNTDGLRMAESPIVYMNIIHTFERLISRYQRLPRKQMVIKLLAMHNKDNFVSMAQVYSKGQVLHSTEDVLESLGVVKFHELICQFMKVSKKDFETFMKSLRNEFDGV